MKNVLNNFIFYFYITYLKINEYITKNSDIQQNQ
jgi:hypothetical protein